MLDWHPNEPLHGVHGHYVAPCCTDRRHRPAYTPRSHFTDPKGGRVLRRVRLSARLRRHWQFLQWGCSCSTTFMIRPRSASIVYGGDCASPSSSSASICSKIRRPIDRFPPITMGTGNCPKSAVSHGRLGHSAPRSAGSQDQLEGARTAGPASWTRLARLQPKPALLRPLTRR